MMNGSLKIEKSDMSIMTKEEASDSIDAANDLLHDLELTAKINNAIHKHLSLNRKSLSESMSNEQSKIHAENSSISSDSSSNVSSNSSSNSSIITDSSSMLIDRSKKVFKKENHFYPKVVNAKIHPLVASFFKMSNESIMTRYKQMNPHVNVEALRKLLAYRPKYFKWAGKWLNILLLFYHIICG
jgi:hypothetical protein